MTRNLTRQDPSDPPLDRKPHIHDPTCQNRVLGKLLMRNEPKMSEFTGNPKPPTTRLHPYGSPSIPYIWGEKMPLGPKTAENERVSVVNFY